VTNDVSFNSSFVMAGLTVPTALMNLPPAVRITLYYSFSIVVDWQCLLFTVCDALCTVTSSLDLFSHCAPLLPVTSVSSRRHLRSAVSGCLVVFEMNTSLGTRTSRAKMEQSVSSSANSHPVIADIRTEAKVLFVCIP